MSGFRVGSSINGRQARTPMIRLACLLVALILRSTAVPADEPGIELVNPVTYRLKIELEVKAEGANLTRITAKCPLPDDWREQKVKLLGETKPKGTVSRDQAIQGLGRVWVVSAPRLSAGRSLKFERIYEVKRFQVVSRLDPETLSQPDKVTKNLRAALGSSPGIEIADADLKQLAAELSIKRESPWEYARAAADWVRKNVRYQLGEYRGAKFAFTQRLGDCEDLSALFIALCRIEKIPARTVWVEGHAYPEFYLTDGKAGFWIPVQLHGPEAFGSIKETRPILQKGDSYRNPRSRRTVRYLPQEAIAYGGKANLSVKRTILKPAPVPLLDSPSRD